MRDLIKEIGAFIFLEDAPQAADLILVCGSARTEPVERAAALYHAGYAPLVLPTGRFGQHFANLRSEMERLALNDGRDPEAVFARMEEIARGAGHPGFPETEWAHQRNILVSAGVPEEAILREDQSVNTFENAFFARHILEERGLLPKTMILCCQAFHARRAYQTVQSEFPETKIVVCPADTRGITRTAWFENKTGFGKVMEELMKCGDYFRGEEMFAAWRKELPLSRVEALADSWMGDDEGCTRDRS